MSEVSAFVGIMIAISMAVERCVEILKGMIPQLGISNTDPTKDGRRSACVQGLAVFFGALIAEVSKTQIAGAVPSVKQVFDGGWLVALAPCLLVGFMASGGSGFWNHILDLLGAMKVKQEAVAQADTQLQLKAAAAKAT